MHPLYVTNSVSGKRERFIPLHAQKVNLYVCGITPYDYAHVGHGRCYVTFDTVYRVLNFFGYDVTYCRNFTDIDDKLLHRAEKELGSPYRYAEVAQKFIDAYHEDMQQLQCKAPTYEPRVTQTIPEIIEFVQALVEAGKAYVVDGSVYYRIAACPDYGSLSHRNLEDLQAGARVEVNEHKENPLDFVLWKAAPGEPFWQSPWGVGRPGWHIECSAMSYRYLGKQLDIHGGGMDLIFPHHENEKAQSEGRFEMPYVSYWMHNAFVRINKEKMSKSLNNFFTLRDLFAKFDPMVIRYYFLIHHYRNPLDFAWEDVASLQKAYEKLIKLLSGVESAQLMHFTDIAKLTNERHRAFLESMAQYLADDLNIAGMIGYLFESADILKQDRELAAYAKALLQNILGLTFQPLPEKEVIVTPEIQTLIDQRIQARTEKNWAQADALRDQLKALGYEVQDKK